MKTNTKERNRAWRSITVIVVVVSVLVIAMAGIVSAKSLYVIADINAYPNIPIQAYDIQPAPTYLAYQTLHGIPDRDGGTVGLACDTDSGYLFATFEFSSKIDLINGTTMLPAGQVTAPGASDLAGIVVDQGKQKVYAVDRTTNHLYVYSWDASTKTLTNDITTSPYHIPLSGVTCAYGIALDEVNDLLYVGDYTTTVKYYNTSDWSQAGSFTVSHKAMGIAVDVINGFVYTGSWDGNKLLSKYDLSTTTESTVNVGNAVLGLAVDPEKGGLVYITTKGYSGATADRLIVYNSGLTQKWISGDIGNPTGLCIPGKDISYNPLQLSKDDGLAAGACVSPGDTITYTMTYTNGNPNTVTGVTLVDTVPPEVTVTSTGGGTQSGNTVTWNIGTLTTGQSGSKTLTVTVNSGVTPGSTIDNAATINGNEPNTGPTTKHEYTDVCTNQPPVADAGPDQIVEQDSLDGASATLDGSGSTDDGKVAPLTYTWAWTGGSATGVSPTVTLPMGMTTVTLTVYDGQFTDTDTVDVTVQDTTPPVITCPADVTVEQANAAGTVVPLTATATDICDADPTIASDELAIYPLGTTTVTFTATDDSGNSASCTTTVTVVDTTSPDISVTVSPDMLWPPNHKMVDIVATVTVSDICDVAPSVVLTSITSDEPDNTHGTPWDADNGASGDGNTNDDIQADIGTEDCDFQLRAERCGTEDGRVYTITYTVTDASGNSANAIATVEVPHDMG